ncbi:MAG: TonB-dependent receptor plug domain-containing protein [bacterium]|nr:TonB-dependent receptor plug domain-containing protein [bacterium]
MKHILSILCFILCPAFFALPLSAQQPVIITGMTSDEFGQPLKGVRIELKIESKKFNSRTYSDNRGKYKIEVPGDQIVPDLISKLHAWIDGYYPFEAGIVLDSPEITTNILLNSDPLGTGEKFRSGMQINTNRDQRTFDIDKITSDDIINSPAQNPGLALQGKIGGVKPITPGGNPDLIPEILLGAANSIFNGNQPLVIIDGIRSPWGLEDIEVLDIREIQVTQGAAGASLYGVRGANGVIELFTDRGKQAPGVPGIKIRSEYGLGMLAPHDFPVTTHHHYLTDGTRWIDNDGNEVGLSGRVPDTSGPNGTVFQDNDYFLSIFDNVDSFYESGHFYSNYASINQTSGTAAWKLSASSVGNSGIIKNMDGYNRNNFRMIFRKQARNDLHITFGGYLMKSITDNPQSYNNYLNPFDWLSRVPVGIDIDPGETYFLPEQQDSVGNAILIPGINIPNPVMHTDLYKREIDRIRAMSNINILYEPSNDLIFESNFGIDRLDINETEFIPYELPESLYGDNLPFLSDINRDLFSLNTDISVSKNKKIRALQTSWKIQYNFQNLKNEAKNSVGTGLSIDSTGTSNWGDNLTAYSEKSEFSIQGLSLVSAWNYENKYMGDLVLSGDYNSQLTGAEKWNNYFRISTAYRISEEPWFIYNEKITDFKLRYAAGSAGSLKNFLPETVLLDDHVTTANLYIPDIEDLKPEYSFGHEIGLDLTFLDRVSIGIDYTFTNTKNQIFNISDIFSSSYIPQWQNLGTIESDLFKFDLKINLVTSREFSWTTGFILSHADQRIRELDGTYYLNTQQRSFNLRKGDDLGSIYGTRWAGSISDLGELGMTHQDQFNINDNGLLVWVGSGNTWHEGLTENLWGQSVSLTNADISREFSWGMPIEVLDEDGNSTHRIGKLTPDFIWSWTNMIRWNDFTIHTLMDAQVGGSVYNYAAQSAYRDYRHFSIDQSGKSENLHKPLEYYDSLSGPYGYNSWFLEDGSFVRLRDFSVKYNFTKARIIKTFGEAYAKSIRSLSLGFSLRNWLTWTDYTGFDPDTGGSIYRFDDGLYPHSRQISAFIEIEF